MSSKLDIALEALDDIANGAGKVRVTDEMLSSKEAFHAAFGALLQKRAREALTEIQNLKE